MGSETVQTVKVVVAGDASGSKRAFTETEAAAGSAASKIKAHFSNVMGALSSNQALAPIMGTFSEFQGMFQGLSDKAGNLGEKFSKVGLGVAGVGGALTMLGDKGKVADQQLAQAFTNAGANVDDYGKQISATVDHMAKYGYTAEETKTSLQTLVQATKNPTLSLKDMAIAADLAAAKHESLSTATNQLAQIIAGKGTKTLQTLGITVSKTSVTVRDAHQGSARRRQGRRGGGLLEAGAAAA